eukprot:g12698.t1
MMLKRMCEICGTNSRRSISNQRRFGSIHVALCTIAFDPERCRALEARRARAAATWQFTQDDIVLSLGLTAGETASVVDAVEERLKQKAPHAMTCNLQALVSLGRHHWKQAAPLRWQGVSQSGTSGQR